MCNCVKCLRNDLVSFYPSTIEINYLILSLTEPPGDNCSKEECSNEEDIPHPSAEQVAAQLQPSMVPYEVIAFTSTSSTGASCLHPEPSLEALTL